MPNWVTGLMPMELFTKTRADYCDLFLMHVCKCPVFVLEPKLQESKEIPEYNCSFKVGTFLGFFDEHFLLVSDAPNLTTVCILQ